MKYFFILSASCVLLVSACKNDRTDITHLDTAAMVPSISPLPATADSSAIARTDNAQKPGSLKPENKTEKEKALPGENKRSIETEKATPADEVRLKKVSKKGKIVLQMLKLNTQEQILPDNEGIYNRAEVMPVYPGGEQALRDYIGDHIRYPELALNNDIKGTVKVQFAIDEQGKIISPTVVSPTIGHGLEQEALRVVRQMPRWIPGKVNGQNVKTRFTLPVTYTIE